MIEQYIDELSRTQNRVLTASIERWQSGVTYEEEFWTNWFANRGGEWGYDYVGRLTARPLEDRFASLLPEAAKCSVLDVGAGPMSILGTQVKGKTVELIAIDPLADIYDRIIRQNGVDPPVRTARCFGETISCYYDECQFDLVHCRNALDHSLEPIWALIEMYLVAKVGCSIVLEHRANEAEFENYTGFHQWNLDSVDGKFHVWNRGQRFIVDELFCDSAAIECRKAADGWLSVRLLKKDNMLVDQSSYHKKMRKALFEMIIDNRL